MSDKNAQQDPSMEEILASIRRIISEDETAEGENQEGETAGEADAGEAAPGEEAPEDDGDDAVDPDDVLELTQMVQEDGSTVDLTEESEAESEPSSTTLPEAPQPMD